MNNHPPAAPVLLPDERVEFVDSGGLRLLCRHWGAVDAPAIVLLHGLRGFSGTWRSLAATLSRQYRLIAFDQRGRGDSDWDPDWNYYTDAYLADLETIVDRFTLRRFFLVGHSMGGTTSYLYAQRHPQRLASLVIEDIAPGASICGPGAQRVVGEMLTLPKSFDSWAEARAYWRSQRSTLSDSAVEQRVAESLRAAPDGRIVWRYDARGIGQTRVDPDPNRIVDLWPVVDRLQVPTLIIRGQRSDFCPESSVAEMIRRNSRISSITVANAGHYVHDDAPELFAQHLTEFLRRTTPS
ncbi:MAG: alpha/beta hydrolase [Pseudomonadota bacterium]|nr:alpha/beta hydrolase [Pseudomonadota bacterium]